MEINRTKRVRICVPMHLLSNPKTMHNSYVWMIGWLVAHVLVDRKTFNAFPTFFVFDET